MTTPRKMVSNLILLVMACYLVLCFAFYLTQGYPSYMRDVATALVSAMIGGVAAASYLNFIGMSARERE